MNKHGVSQDNIVIGEGIDGLLGYLVRMFVDPVVMSTSDGAYPTFNYHVAGAGGTLQVITGCRGYRSPDCEGDGGFSSADIFLKSR